MFQEKSEKSSFPKRSSSLRSPSDSPAITSKNVFMFVNYSKDWPLILVGILLMGGSAIATPMNTYIYGEIMGKLSQFYLQDQSNHSFSQDIVKLCVGLIGIGCCKMILVWLGMFTWLKFGEIQQSRARMQIYNKIINESQSWYDSKQNLIGQLTQINRCIEELRSCNGEILASLMQTIVLILALLIMSFYQSWSTTLIIMASFPIMALCGWYFGKLTYKAQQDENEVTSKASKVFNWCYVNPEMVRFFNSKNIELTKFKQLIEKSAQFYYKLSHAVAANTAVLKTLTLMMFVQGFWFGNYLLSHNTITINQLFTCFSSCLMLGQAVSGITELLAILNTGHAAADKISGFLLQPPSKAKLLLLHSKYPPFEIGSIYFKNVWFESNSQNSVAILQDVSFGILQNQFNYVIGKSGSGKSTIAKLLMRLYSVSRGTIEIDTVSIDKLDPKYICQNIILLEQNPVIFDDKTIAENIAIAIVDDYDSLQAIPYYLIEQSAHFALLSDLDLNMKVNQLTLSGGQQQRISIARAYLKNSPVLIMDESFSALDTETKQCLIEKVKKWRIGKTTIFITHEYKNILDDENVIILDQGMIKNQGQFKKMKNEEIVQNYKSQGIETSSYETTSQSFSDNTKLPDGDYNYKTNPYILKDLESQIKEDTDNEKLMGVLAILRYCSSTINGKSLLGFGILLAIFQGVSSPVFSYCFSKLLSTSLDSSIGLNSTQKILQWSCISLSIAIFTGVTSYLSEFILNYCGENWIVSLRQLTFFKLNNQDLSFFTGFDTNWSSSEITALLMNDTRDLRNLISQFFPLLANLVSMTLIGIIWSIVSGWKLALVGISFVPLVLLVTVLYGKILESIENKYKCKVNNVELDLYRTITTIRTIKIFNIQQYFETVFKEDLKVLNSIGVYRALQTGIGFAISDLFSSIGQAIILFYGMKLISQFQYNYSQLLQVITLLSFTISNASILIHQLPEITRGQRAGTFIVKLLKDITSTMEVNDSCGVSSVRKRNSKSGSDSIGTIGPVKDNQLFKKVTTDNDTLAISFNNVSFSYPNKLPHILQLKSISLDVKKFTTIGIVGQSGSGKSTILKILFRLYDIKISPDSNTTKKYHDQTVKIFNQNLYLINSGLLCQTIAIVPQFPKFFSGTIYDNLTYGINNTNSAGSNSSSSVSDSEIIKILKLVNLHQFIVSLPQGLLTIMNDSDNDNDNGNENENENENGNTISTSSSTSFTFSGGQLQLLAIARALLRNPKILLLDECTSNLDPITTKIIINVIKSLHGKLTILFVTHDKELMRIADNLIVMKDGQIVEQGDFQQLISNDGEFTKITKTII
ncbi:alpha-factor-transporting ATPase [Candida albicans P57072]|nr:alpha-factor-transporting ATPase [Candida albicans P57072]